jgi:uncharacterized protein YqeY
MREQLGFEIAFCDRFLPQKLGDAEVRALVKDAIARLGVTDARQAGRVVGEIMKAHKGVVDAGTAKRIAEELLTAIST